jgi:methylated-DNA-[protein]-cysteine S-methyltransferase
LALPQRSANLRCAMSDTLHTLDTPLGPLLLCASPAGLRGAWFVGQRHFPDLSPPAPRAAAPSHPVLASACLQLQEYFAGERRQFTLSLDLSRGTPFQQQVWNALLAIDWGQTTRYGQLAHQLGRPQASRAVGLAVGRNPVSIIVPCHRVLGADGSLTGYAGGLDRKQSLLQREGVL